MNPWIVILILGVIAALRFTNIGLLAWLATGLAAGFVFLRYAFQPPLPGAEPCVKARADQQQSGLHVRPSNDGMQTERAGEGPQALPALTRLKTGHRVQVVQASQ